MTVVVSSHIFSQWGWLIPFFPDDFPGLYIKGGESARTPLFLNYFSSRTDLSSLSPLIAEYITMRRAQSNSWPLCPGINPSLFIETFFDQRLLDDLNWMFNSTSHIHNFIPALISTTRLSSWLQRFDSCTDVGYFISVPVFRTLLFLPPTSTRSRTFGWMLNSCSTLLQLFFF